MADKESELPKHLEQRNLKDGKEYSPSAARNTPPLLEQLSELWPQKARVLEIASGTGQHGLAFCQNRPDISWQYSDYDAAARQSQEAWAADLPEQLSAPIAIDVLQDNWWKELSGYNAIFCANMIHIAPSACVEGLARGARQILPQGACFFLYGPFQEGEATAQSNLDFDANLKRRNPDWGVRNLSDVKHIFASHGLSLGNRVEMPKENRLLVFKKSD